MLWIPPRKTLKALARKKRRKRRRRIARLLFFLFLLFGVRLASVPPEHDLLTQVNCVTASYQFDFIDWESQAIISEIKRRLTPPLLPTTITKQRALVQKFLDLETNSRRLTYEINQIYAASNNAIPPKVSILEQELTQVKATQVEIAPQVEILVSQQIETILQEEGFIVAGHVSPPVAFRLIYPPTALILSPRDQIKNQYFTGLQPGLDNNRRFEIEDILDQRGDVSSYITNVGGLGSYPSMVINTSNLSTLIDIAAHEWTHNYLFTFPTNIAWNYQTYPRLTTINETGATLVAKEISRKVVIRYYPNWIDKLPPVDDKGIPTPREPSEFDQAMRRIRQHVDHLLAESKIAEAEAYMEIERLKLVEKGYNLRKLNQAYFAFHGSYAFGPASIDPTGSQLRQLRVISPSLKDFLDHIGWLNSYGDYLAWLEESGIEP